VTRTDSGFQSVNAFTGDADQVRHESQWQYPMFTGAPATAICTAPQKHDPSYVLSFSISVSIEQATSLA